MKNDVGWNLRISEVERYLSDVPVSRNWHKTVSKLSQVQYTGHMIQTETSDKNTALPLVWVLVTCSGCKKKYYQLYLIKMKNYETQIITGATLFS